MTETKPSAGHFRLERLGREGRQQPTPGQPDPAAVKWWRRLVVPIVRLAFRPRLEGAQHLPQDGGYLLVANHSGLGNADIGCLIAVFLDGEIRPAAAMVHPVSFNSWPAGMWMQKLGAIPATYDAAHASLTAGVPVLTFPGGDIDATRPVWQANSVDFGGRKGFLKIARKARLPVVPLGIRGSDFTAPILFRSAILSALFVFPKVMGVRRFPVTLLGVLGAAALLALGGTIGWIVAPVLALLWILLPPSTLPWIPWTVRLRIGRPFAPDDLFPDESDETLARAYHRVHAAVEALVRSRSANPDD